MAKSTSGKPNWKDKIKISGAESTNEPGYALRGWTVDRKGVLVGVKAPHPKKRFKSDYSPHRGGKGSMHGVFSIADLDQFMNDSYSTHPVVGIISYGLTTRNDSHSGYIRSNLVSIKKLFVREEEALKDPALVYHLSQHYGVPVDVFNDREELRDKLYNDLTTLDVVNPRVKRMTPEEYLEAAASGEFNSEVLDAQKKAITYEDALPYPEFPKGLYDTYQDTTRIHPRQLQHIQGLNEAFQNARKNRDEYHSMHFRDENNHLRLHTFSSMFAHTKEDKDKESLKYEGWEEVSWKEFKTRLQEGRFSPGTWILLERRPRTKPLHLDAVSKDPGSTFTEEYLHRLGSEAAYRIDERGVPHRFSDFSNYRWEIKDSKTGEYFSIEGAMDYLKGGKVWDDTLRNKVLIDKLQNKPDDILKDLPEQVKFLYRNRKSGDTPDWLDRFVISLQEGNETSPGMSSEDTEIFNKDLLIRGFLGGTLRGDNLRLLGKSSEIMPKSEMDKYKWNKEDNSLTYIPTGRTLPFDQLKRGLEKDIEATNEPFGYLNH